MSAISAKPSLIWPHHGGVEPLGSVIWSSFQHDQAAAALIGSLTRATINGASW